MSNEDDRTFIQRELDVAKDMCGRRTFAGRVRHAVQQNGFAGQVDEA